MTKRLEEVSDFAQMYMKQHNDFLYHNFEHAQDVTRNAHLLAQHEDISTSDQELLSTACLTHDLIAQPGNKYNEELTCQLVGMVLPDYGYSSTEIDTIQDVIMDTKLPNKPTSKLGKIIADADLSNLSRFDFWRWGDNLRHEIGASLDTAWYEGQLAFLESREYFTDTAKKLWTPGLELNTTLLRGIVSRGGAPEYSKLIDYGVHERLFPSALRHTA